MFEPPVRDWLAPTALVTLCTLACALAPHRARADAPEGSRDQADAHFRAGVQALRDDDPETAVAHFHRSQQLYPRVTTACNLALAYDRWPGHANEAAAAYDRCAALDDGGSYRQHALERAAAIRAEQAAQRSPSADPTHTPIIESPVWGQGATTWGSAPPPGTVGPQPIDTPGPSATWLVLGIGATTLAAIALGVGAALELDAQSRADALLLRYPDYNVAPEDADELESIRSQRDLGIGLYVGAAVFGAFGLGSLFVFFSELVSGPSATTVSASAGPEGGRLLLRTRF